jgi:hypothetical protein
MQMQFQQRPGVRNGQKPLWLHFREQILIVLPGVIQSPKVADPGKGDCGQHYEIGDRNHRKGTG